MTDTSALPPTRRPFLVHRRGVFALFFVYAAVLGGILSRLADMQLRMGVGESALGIGLLGMPLGTQIMLMLGAPTVRRLGLHRTTILGMALLGLGQIVASTALSIPLFFAALTFAGLGIGAIEVVLNLEADRGEHMLGRRIMNRAHSFWSFGFMASGLIGAAAASAHLAPMIHLVALNIVGFGLTLLILREFEAAPPRRPKGAPDDGPAARLVWPDAVIMGLLAVTLSAMMLEGAANDWSIIYMRDAYHTPPGINGLAFAIGAGAQAVTRYFGDALVDRLGPLRAARNVAILLGFGTLVVTFSHNAALALAGFAMMGVGTAILFPLAVSAAAQRSDRPAAESVASLAQTSFMIFLLTPPLLGFVAEHLGVRSIFALGLPLVVLTLVFKNRLAPR